MNEREFIKVNTSIQTGSNVNDLKYDADGNIEARIALRLPANLFDNNAGTRKIDKVTMATSKMRLSLENTPIASLPVESETVKNNTLVLKPQLDVYPFSLTGEKLLVPTSLNDSSLPLYKSHEVLYRIQVVTVLEPLTYISGGQLQYFPNSPDVYQNTSSLFYPILEKTGVLEQANHKLNLMMQNNHEPFKMENGHVLIKSLSTLCQIFQDALENAITYASTNDNRVIDVFFVDSTLNVDSLSPNVDKSATYDINGTTTYYWKTENVSATGGSNLNCACKPLVRFNSQSFSISLDTCVFKDIVPIIWNTAFINTFERPQQLIQDLLRQNYWIQPPPKRVYKYGLHQVADESYSYYLLQTLTCRVMNIIGDKIMRDCFSFLPWVEVPQSLVLGGNSYLKSFNTETITTITETSNPPIITNTDITPNLKQENRDSFYLLDGTTCDITIGPQEPILTSERLERWKITTTTTYEKFEEVDADVYKSGPGFTNVITDYETETTEFLVENPTGERDQYDNGAIQYFFAYDEDYAASDPVPWTVPAYSIGLRMVNNEHHINLTTTSRTTTGSASGGYTRTDVGPYERVDPPPTTVEVTYSDDPSLEPGTTTEDEETRTRETMPWRRSELITSGPIIHAENNVSTEHPSKWVTLTHPRPYQPGFFTAVFPNIATNAGISILHGYADTSFAAICSSSDFDPVGSEYIRGNGSVVVDGHTIHYAFVWCAEEVVEAGQTSKYVPVVRVEKYYEVSAPVKTTVLIAHKTTVIEPILNEYGANLRLTYTWDNLPMVVLSPIQSIVLILDGMNVNQEFLPVNITEQTGSSLVSSVAVIENFYSLATTLRDLHDELIVIKDTFNDMATYNVDDASGKERTLTLTAKYITKDGSIHSIYIPPNGVFTVQLTFRLDFFTSSSTY